MNTLTRSHLWHKKLDRAWYTSIPRGHLHHEACKYNSLKCIIIYQEIIFHSQISICNIWCIPGIAGFLPSSGIVFLLSKRATVLPVERMWALCLLVTTYYNFNLTISFVSWKMYNTVSRHNEGKKSLLLFDFEELKTRLHESDICFKKLLTWVWQISAMRLPLDWLHLIKSCYLQN